MNSPQKEDGYTGIANEIVEALCRTNLSPYESRVLWCVFRKTYGWNKKEDWISLPQLVTMTGMHKSHISRSKKKLLDRKIITQTGNKIAFNKFYTQWRELPKQVTLPKQVINITQTGNKALPKQAYTKDNKQINNVVDKKIMRWLETTGAMNPERYLNKMKKEFGDVVYKAWEKVQGKNNIKRPSD